MYHKCIKYNLNEKRTKQKNTITHVYSFHPRKLPHQYNTITGVYIQCLKQIFIKSIIHCWTSNTYDIMFVHDMITI